MTDELREQTTEAVGSYDGPDEKGEDTGLTASPPERLTEIDKLRLQNAFLRFHAVSTQMGSIRTQMEVLRRDAAKADEELVKVRKELEAVRGDIEKRYAVDLKKTTVNQDGVFVPLNASAMPFPVNGGQQ
jgi:hypothetical protein